MISSTSSRIFKSLEKQVAKATSKVKQTVNTLTTSASEREFDSLIRSIGECKSKQEEDRIMASEIETLKGRLNDPKLDKARIREYMVRAIYIEMLGHDASWTHVKALQFASEPQLINKKAAYLAATSFLDASSELLLLIVNTILSDLKSDNYIVVCTALVATCKLIGPDLINAVLPSVIERLHHPKEHVRKKAVMVLHKFSQLDPRREGPLLGFDLDRHLRTALCDKDPSVMSAALSALHEAIKQDPRPYKNLVPSFTSILKQVSESRLPRAYDYHKVPAPFIQIKLLKILAALGMGDRQCSENIYAVVHQCLKRANGSHTIGSAIIYECVRVITTIYPSPPLLNLAADSIATFLKSPSHNLRYVGIDALAGIVKINSQYAQEHQLAVIDCLEDPDDTLRLKTLALLYKMTKASNVEVIVERMMTYLRSTSDEHVKRDIVRKVSELAERYAPSPTWFVSVVSEVFELGGDHVDASLSHSLIKLIAEQDSNIHKSAVEVYLTLLDKPKLPPSLLMVACWVVGEYGSLANPSGQLTPAQRVMSKLTSAMVHQKSSDEVKGYVLSAITKLCAHTGSKPTPEAERMAHQCLNSQSLELQERSYELIALLSSKASLLQSVLPFDGSCEEITAEEMTHITHLSFLDGYVKDALRRGSAPYAPLNKRRASGALSNPQGPKAGGLRFEAYESGSQERGHSRNPSYGSGHALSSELTLGVGSSVREHNRNPSYGDVGISTVAPAVYKGVGGGVDLHLRAGGGRSNWGPAQFDPPSQAAPAAAAAAVQPKAPLPPPLVDLLDFSSPPEPPRPYASPPPSSLDQLFGGGGGGGGGGGLLDLGDLLGPSQPIQPFQPFPLPGRGAMVFNPGAATSAGNLLASGWYPQLGGLQLGDVASNPRPAMPVPGTSLSSRPAIGLGPGMRGGAPMRGQQGQSASKANEDPFKDLLG